MGVVSWESEEWWKGRWDGTGGKQEGPYVGFCYCSYFS